MTATKSQMARGIAAGIGLETFQHESLGHFNVTDLRTLLHALPFMTIHFCRFDEIRIVDGIQDDPLQYIVGAREVDWARVDELSDEQIEDPVIFLDCPPGTNGQGRSQLLIDGVHRLCARHKRGKVDFRFFLVPLELAPRVDPKMWREIPWGEKDLIPGVGLVDRRR